MKTNKTKIISLSLCAIFALQSNLFAQDVKDTTTLQSVDVTAEEEAETSYTIKNTSTATGLNLSLKETPQSVSVLTSQKIEDMGLSNISDVVDTVTGLYNNTTETERVGFSARGFSINNYLIDGVSTTWDGQVMTGEGEQSFTIFDSVEVVRGANGLITGSGEPSASINLVRKRADSKEFKGNTTFELGSWNKYKSTVDLQGALNENGTIRGRIALSHEEKESFINFFEKETNVFYGVVDFDISDNTKASLGFSYQNNKPKGSVWGGIPVIDNNGKIFDYDRSISTASNQTYFNSKNKNYFANIEHYFDNNIKVYGSYSRSDSTGSSSMLYRQYNASNSIAYGTGAYDNYRKQDNLDLKVSIPFNTSKLEHEVLIGATYSKQKDSTDGTWGGGTISTLLGLPVNYIPVTSSPWKKSTEIIQSGVYLVGKFSLSEQLKFILGTRVSNYKNKNKLNDDVYEDNAVITPYTGLVYNINPDLSAYASYTNIFKPQSKTDINGSTLDPEEGNAFEVGLKAEFFEDKLNTSVSIFKINKENVAERSSVVSPTTGQLYYTMIDGTTSKGFELQVDGEVSDDWNIGAGYSQFKAIDNDNNEISLNVPRKTLRLFTKYRLGKLNLGGGVNYRSSIESTTLTQKAIALVNIMGKYEFSESLSAQINIKNIFDKKYYSNINNSTISYGTPRNGTISLKYKF